VQPDRQRDVFIHHLVHLNPVGKVSKEEWILSVGSKRMKTAASREAAMKLAGQLVAQHGRPAWLLQESPRPLLVP
jgi:hypothetical protein